MTTEPPQGIKQNLKRVFTNLIDQDTYGLQDKNSKDKRKLMLMQLKSTFSVSAESEKSGGTDMMSRK
jgi:hypothetical protein